MQERDSQQACLDFTVTSQEGSCPVKALSKAGVLTSTHRWERERKQTFFISWKLHRSACDYCEEASGLQTTQGGSPSTSHLHMVSVLGKDSRAEQK